MARQPQIPARPACRLYLITPAAIPDLEAFAAELEAALAAGDCAALQIRLKAASDEEIRAAVARLKPICQTHDVALILNDRPDLARATGCDGVHVGQEDASLAEARRIMGEGAMIGVTCHDSRHLAMDAGEAGADYVAFGAFFPTTTKQVKHMAGLDLLEWWQAIFEIPCVAIGGITPENCGALVKAGADFLAVSGAVWNGDEVAAVKAFHEAMTAAQG